MKFILPVCDYDYSDGIKTGTINGGTVWLHNICEALKWHGYDAEVVPLSFGQSDADYMIIQSEWTGMPEYQQFKGKKIVLLGHFIKHVYPDPHAINADCLVTMWEGELLEGFNTFFMPHGYSDLLDDNTNERRRGDIVWAGNPYALRNESWFEGLTIEPIRGTYPKDLFHQYRGSGVCINLHGDFQKNIVSKEPSKLADKPGMMVNERFWNVLGCGGLLVTDWIPQMIKWFTKDELICAETKEEYQELVKYYVNHKQEGLEKLKTAREKVRNFHTYRHRVRDLLKQLNLDYKVC